MLSRIALSLSIGLVSGIVLCASAHADTKDPPPDANQVVQTNKPAQTYRLVETSKSGETDPPVETNKDGKDPMVLPPVSVQGQMTDEPLSQPSLEQQAERLQRVPGGTNLVDAEQYKDRKAGNIYDALQGQPGVQIDQRGGGTEEAKVTIRGAGLDRTYNTQGIWMLQDGIPITMADGDGDFQSIEPFAYRSVNIYRGANALQYGGTALGGAINFISPTGYNAPRFQTRMETGSYGYLKEQISSGGVLGKFDYYLSVTGHNRHGYQWHSRSKGESINANCGYRWTPKLESRAFFTYVNTTLDLPDTLTKQQIYQNPRGFASPGSRNAELFNERRNGNYQRAAHRLSYQIDEKQHIDFDVFMSRRFLFHPLLWNPFFLNGLGILHLNNVSWGTNIRYTNDHDLLCHENHFTAGFVGQWGPGRQENFQNVNGHQGRQVANIKEFFGNETFFAQNEHYIFPRLALVTGANYAFAQRDYRDMFNFTPGGRQVLYQKANAFNPKGGLIFKISPTMQAYMNFSRAFTPPTDAQSIQLLGPNGNIKVVRLSPEVSKTFEIGTRGASKRFAWDLTYYYSWINHEFLTLANSVGQPVGTISATPTRHNGFETGASVIVLRGLLAKQWKKDEPPSPTMAVGPGFKPLAEGDADRIVFRPVYNWNNFHFKNDPVYHHNRLPAIPPNVLYSTLFYEHPSGFYCGPTFKWVMTRTPADYANTLYANAYSTSGWTIGYRSKSGNQLFVQMQNMFNHRYVSSIEPIASAAGSSPKQVFSPGEGRAVYVGIQLVR